MCVCVSRGCPHGRAGVPRWTLSAHRGRKAGTPTPHGGQVVPKGQGLLVGLSRGPRLACPHVPAAPNMPVSHTSAAVAARAAPASLQVQSPAGSVARRGVRAWGLPATFPPSLLAISLQPSAWCSTEVKTFQPGKALGGTGLSPVASEAGDGGPGPPSTLCLVAWIPLCPLARVCRCQRWPTDTPRSCCRRFVREPQPLFVCTSQPASPGRERSRCQKGGEKHPRREVGAGEKLPSGETCSGRHKGPGRGINPPVLRPSVRGLLAKVLMRGLRK